MISQSQIDFFNENGFLRLEQVYSPAEMEVMSKDLMQVMEVHGNWNSAWRGPWRKEYMEDDVNQKAQLVSIHELQHYAASWMRALTKPELAADIAVLLGSESVEIHHNTLHAKGPSAGAPFPMHQDIPFYPHENGSYIDALIHIDNADEESGCIKFLAGSHKLGPLEHITGPETEPHLPTDKYRLEDAVSVPANAGDVVIFHLWTIHGSSVNRAGRWRRLVRVGFRDPLNKQVAGQALGRPGLIVHGVRPKAEGVNISVYGNWNPAAQAEEVK